MPDLAVTLEASVKAVLYAALLPALGVSATRWLLLPRAAADLGAEAADRLAESIANLGLAAASIVLIAILLRVWTHTVSAFGFQESLTWEALRLIAFDSRWGAAWAWQACGAALLVVTYAWTNVHPPSGWPATVLAAAGLCGALPLLGHAAGSPGRVALHAIHVAGAAVWLGTLTVVAAVARDDAVRSTLLRRFSPIALSSAATVAAAGLVASWSYLGAFSTLWTTAYGRILVLKIGLACGVAACGFLNWQRLRASDGQPRHPLRAVTLELVLAAAVVAVTGVLTEIDHP